MSSPSASLTNIDKTLQETEEKDIPIDETSLSIWDKFKLIICTYWRGLVCIISPIILIPLILSFPTKKYQWCGYTLVLMAIFWVTECIPLPVTSFLPVIVFPLTGIMSTAECCRCYMNDTIMMFLGSMILAYSVEQSGLHKRLALWAIRAIGYSHYKYRFSIYCRQCFHNFHQKKHFQYPIELACPVWNILLFAMCFITMFISMWITNTAATTLMVPINFALLKVFEEQSLLSIYEINKNGESVASDITTCYFCAATFSATIGGVGTLVGTATNFVFKGLFSKTYPNAPEYLSFPKFSAFALPYMFLMEAAMYLYLVIVYLGFLRPKSDAAQRSKLTASGIEAAKKVVNEDYNNLGRITFWEIMVILLFSFGLSLFFCRSPQIFTGWGDGIVDYFTLGNKKFIGDSAAAMLVAFLMYLLPSTLNFFNNCRAKVYEDLPKHPIPSVLQWKTMNDIMPYSFMFLLGGGFALSEAAKEEYTDLNGKIGAVLSDFRYLGNGTILLLIIMFTVFITNFASNVAVCNVITPIVMQLAKEINQNPLWYNIAAGYSSSYAFCLPVGTPGNLVVQSVANIPTTKMIKAGFGPTISTIIISWICIYVWAPVLWPDLLLHPDWIENTRTQFN